MNTQQAYHAYQVNAANNANYESTLLWILFTIFVIAPLLWAFIYIGVALFTIPKCPKCGSRKSKMGLQTIKAEGKTTTENVHICRECKAAF